MTDIKPGIYRHFKGGMYEVIGVAKHTETLEEMVVYRALYGEMGLWTRPACMWNELVARDGVTQPRFAYIAADLEELDGAPRFALIEEIAQAMRMNDSEMFYYYHIPKGKVVLVQQEFLQQVEDCDDDETFDGEPDWRKGSLLEALYLSRHEDEYLPIPCADSRGGYEMMERFIDDAPMNPKSRELLTEAIQGRGAFRRFKDTLSHAHMEEAWFAYRDAAYRSRAREWCNENNIQWGEKLC